jgi:hypothetical protein
MFSPASFVIPLLLAKNVKREGKVNLVRNSVNTNINHIIYKDSVRTAQ